MNTGLYTKPDTKDTNYINQIPKTLTIASESGLKCCLRRWTTTTATAGTGSSAGLLQESRIHVLCWMMVLKMGGKVSRVPRVWRDDLTETTNRLLLVKRLHADPVARKPKYFHNLLCPFLFAIILISVADVWSASASFLESFPAMAHSLATRGKLLFLGICNDVIGAVHARLNNHDIAIRKGAYWYRYRVSS